MVFRFLVFYLFLAASLTSYAQGIKSVLENHQDFEDFAGPPLSVKFGDLKAVKMVYDIQKDTLAFLDYKYFKYHIDYCQQYFKIGEFDVVAFNRNNYAPGPKRKFLLADLNYVSSLNQYTISLSPVDKMSGDDMRLLFDKTKSALNDSLDLSFFENNAHIIDQKLGETIPVTKAAAVYAQSNYQAISATKGFGVLRWVENLDKVFHQIKETDILVLKKTPLYLPPVAGVIVAEFQTPLSHLSILGRNRNIPICASKSVWTDDIVKALNGKKVRLEVKGTNFELEEIENIPIKSQDLTAPRLRFLLHIDTLVSFSTADKRASQYIGNKAANFAILSRLSKDNEFAVPESAFAIPFYYYFTHVSDPTINIAIQSLLNGVEGNTYKPADISQGLTEIQKRILEKPIDAELICDIESYVHHIGEYGHLRFRSSTNAEDAPGFSGAGLYDSVTGILYDEKKSFERAIKIVWASLWNETAFLERQYFNMEQRDAFMGVLVHRSFPNEEVNGVAITKNTYREGANGFVVNCQEANEKVVLPSEGAVAEQFICHPNQGIKAYLSGGSTELITYSSLSPDTSLLSQEEVQELANQLGLVKEYFYKKEGRKGPYFEFGLDIEFKIDGKSRQLYFKQVRPYN